MKNDLRKEGKYSYLESGEGVPIIILHGLLGYLVILTVPWIIFLIWAIRY